MAYDLCGGRVAYGMVACGGVVSYDIVVVVWLMTRVVVE